MFKNLLEKDIEKYGNNLGVDIPKLLAEKYPNWIYNTPEILQLDENFNPIKVWSNKKEISEHFRKKVQGIELAIRKSCRFQGYYWMIKVLYEKEGLRPVLTEKRNTPIYTYDPPEEILDNYWNFTLEDFAKEEWKYKFKFLGRFSNSVSAAKFLDLSVTNIRRVSKKELILHKGYYFSFDPILEIHALTADILELSSLNAKGLLREEEQYRLLECMKKFKELYCEEGRIISSAERSIWKQLKDQDL